ncbi:hypothetical protein ABIQ69_02130 [Agromyces sp. G08B096]|uniref:Nucleotide exchange factor GrpE n=1 Tax=Agromyces sp. G08B096 TaxID=3156399 RepID=A0AAU7WAJ9_9MICO
MTDQGAGAKPSQAEGEDPRDDEQRVEPAQGKPSQAEGEDPDRS